MQQLHVAGAVNSVQKLCVVEVSICASIRLINCKGVVSSVTIISMGTKNI